MNARVSCLVLFALLFATAWSHDSVPAKEDRALVSKTRPVPRRHAIAVLARMRRSKNVESHRPLSQSADQAIALRDQQVKPTILCDGIQIPLPDGIGCGNYRVTLADGSETEVQLTECDLAHWGLMQGQSTVGAYMIDGEGVPWRFRRIDAPSENATSLASQIDQTASQIDSSAWARQLLEWSVTRGRTAVSSARWSWGESRDKIQQRAASVVRKLDDGVTEWAQRLAGPLHRMAPQLRFSFGKPSDRRL